MDRMTRNVTIIIAVVIAVGAVFLAFFLTQSKAQKDTVSAPIDIEEKVTLVSNNVEHVKSMKVTNLHGEYTIVPFGEEDEDIGFVYTVEGMDIRTLDTYAVNNIVKYGCNPVSTNNIGNVENLSEYGLDNPIAKVSINFEDGQTYDYNIGKAADEKQDKYYMCAKDSSNVYIIMVKPDMLGTSANLLNKTIFSISQFEYVNKNDYEAAENGFSKIAIANTSLPKQIVFEKVNSKVYNISDYIALNPNYTVLDIIKGNLENLKADEVVAAATTKEQLTQYGLQNPIASITFVVNNQTYQLLVGNEDNGMRYVKKADSDTIYKVNSDKVNDFANATLFTLTDPAIYATDETDFSSIEIKSGEKINTITLEREEDENKSTESKKYFKYIPSLNGNPMEQKIYDALISAIKEAKVEKDTALKAEGTPTLTITLKHFDTDHVETITFYEKGNDVLVVVNDVVRGIMNSKAFTALNKEILL